MNEIQIANRLPTSFGAIVKDKEIRNCVIMLKPHDYPGWASGHAEIRMTAKRWTDIHEYQKEARRQTHNLMISNLEWDLMEDWAKVEFEIKL